MKKAWFLVLISVCMIFLYGCSSASKDQKNMYDDDSLIQRDGDSFNFSKRSGDTNNSKMEVEFAEFYGCETIWNIEVSKQGEIKFDFDSKVNSGEFKGVLISEENEITTIFEGIKQGSHMIIVPNGKYRFKIVGNSTSGKVKVDLILENEMKVTTFKKD